MHFLVISACAHAAHSRHRVPEERGGGLTGMPMMNTHNTTSQPAGERVKYLAHNYVCALKVECVSVFVCASCAPERQRNVVGVVVSSDDTQ